MTEPIKTFDVEEIFPKENESTETVEDVRKAISPVKGFARFAVANSVKFVVTTTLVSLVPTETKLQKGKLLLGSYVISGVIAEKAKDYLCDDLDEKFEFCKDVLAYAKKLNNEKLQHEADLDHVVQGNHHRNDI